MIPVPVKTAALRAGVLCLALAAALGAGALRATGARIQGRVMNATTQRPLSRGQVLLLSPQPQVGMKLIAKTSTDADGRFAFTGNDVNSSDFYLVQVNAQEVPYHFPVRFDSTGTATVDAQVYDSTRSSAALSVSLMRVLVRAAGEQVRVQEQFQVENHSQPPRTYSNPNGTFRFRLPPRASKPQAAVTGLMGMQLPQTPVAGKTAGEYVIYYPLQPGQTPIMVDYQADYAGQQFALTSQVPYPVSRAELYVMPASLTVVSPSLQPAGLDTANGVQEFEASNLAAGAELKANLSGNAPASAASSNPAGENPVQVEPNAMTKLGVPLLICLLALLLWALGIRASKEWSRWKQRLAALPERQQFEAQAEALLNSLADLDELFAAGKIEKKQYWKERLELKARLIANLKKSPPAVLDTYASDRAPR
jgi:hypothetical protein